MQLLESDEDLYALAASFPEVHLFLGYGARAQYADVDEVLVQLASYLDKIQERCGEDPFLAVFGGDKAVEEQPDLGWLMKQMQEAFNCRLLAIQAAGTPDQHCDFGFVAELQFETVRKANAQGQEEEVKQVLYGGTRNGIPVGGSRYYLGPRFIERSPNQEPLLTAMFVMGGGGVALEEVQYADQQGVPWIYVPSRARNEDAYKSTYGPVHDWVHKTVQQEQQRGGQKYVVVKGQ